MSARFDRFDDAAAQRYAGLVADGGEVSIEAARLLADEWFADAFGWPLDETELAARNRFVRNIVARLPGTWVTRDGVRVAGPFADSNDAWMHIHRAQSMSVDWAMEHEGWGIDTAQDGAVALIREAAAKLRTPGRITTTLNCALADWLEACATVLADNPGVYVADEDHASRVAAAVLSGS